MLYVCIIVRIFLSAHMNLYHFNITFLANLGRSTVVLFAR